jgi:hypothetical protein
MSYLPRLSLWLFCNLVSLASLQAQTPQVTWQSIAPGFEASFNKPFVNDAGQAAYLNKTNGFSLGTVGAPAQRNLQPLLSTNGYGLDVSCCIVGDNGRVGYMVEHALIDDAPGAQKILANESGQVPGLPAGVLFDDYTFSDDGSIPMYFAMSPSGVFVLPAILKGTGISVTGTTNINDQVVLRGPASDFKPIARAGDLVPGLPAGYRFVGRLTRRFDVVINRDGVTAIRARAILWNPPSPFPGQNTEGIWLHDPVGGLRLAVKAVLQGTNPFGDDAPGTGGGRFTAITTGPSINDEGYLAFAANTFKFGGSPDNKSGIWSGPTNDLQPVHLFGAPVPGLPGVTFDNPYANQPVKLGVGRTVCFFSVLAGTGVTTANNIGLFIGTSTNDVRLLARVGTQAPGLPPGVVFNSLLGDNVAIFGTNRVAVRTGISGPGVTGGVNDNGLWITDDQGNLQLVGRSNGDPVHTDIGDVILGASTIVQHGTGRDGLTSSGNRRDQLAIFDSSVAGASRVYLLTAGTPAPAGVVLTNSFNRGGLTLAWPNGYKLQRTDTLSPINWGDINAASPYAVPTTNQQGFFRLSQ